MIFHKSHQLSSLFFILFFFFSDWLISNSCVLSQSLSSGRYILLLILSIVFFISFIILLSFRISVGFSLISVFLKTSQFVHVCFPDFWIAFLCFLVAHWVSFKQLFWILYQVNGRSPHLWVWLLEDYRNPLVVSHYHNFYVLLSFSLLSTYLK